MMALLESEWLLQTGSSSSLSVNFGSLIAVVLLVLWDVALRWNPAAKQTDHPLHHRNHRSGLRATVRLALA